MKRQSLPETQRVTGLVEEEFDEEQFAADRLVRRNRNASLDRQGRKRRRSHEDRTLL